MGFDSPRPVEAGTPNCPRKEMSDRNTTPYMDDSIAVENGTQPEEIHEFVRSRLRSPLYVSGVKVWNFNNHKVNKEVLQKQAEEFYNDQYLIPYQASGVWGYMSSLLPEEVRTAEILAYDRTKGRYNPYPNFFRHVQNDEREELRKEFKEIVGNR